MLTKTKEEALDQIKELKKKMLIKSTARLFCCMHVGDKNYVCSMENLERIFDAYLKEVDSLIKEYKLDTDIYLNFRKVTVEMLCDTAMKRKENEWAEYFWKKYAE